MKEGSQYSLLLSFCLSDKSPSNFFITFTPPPTKYRQLTIEKIEEITRNDYST